MLKFTLTFITLACCGCVAAPATTANTNSAPYLLVLGVAQDAGYPQAGCFAQHCLAGWEGRRDKALPVSLGLVDPLNNAQYLFEATPAIGEQLYDLHAANATTTMRLDGIFLTHAHMGHYTGLMHLGREAMGAQGINVYAMPRMARFLNDNGPWSQLVDLGNIALKPLQAEVAVATGQIRVTPFLVPHRDEFSETVGYRIEGPNRSVLFIPDIDKWSKWQRDIAVEIERVDYAFIDATFFDGGELPGRDMSEIPHPFVVESMQDLASLSPSQRRKVWFIHFNHSNPLLLDDSAAAKRVRKAGFGLAKRGMKVDL
ncbi:MAG: MBL fold metallo-hydrolase [Gammaproteobacteria bacterium]